MLAAMYVYILCQLPGVDIVGDTLRVVWCFNGVHAVPVADVRQGHGILEGTVEAVKVDLC